MKVTKKSKSNKVKPYPKLRITNSGLLVLFDCPTSGMVLCVGKTNRVAGGYYRDFIEINFEDYNDSVTVSN